MSNYIFDKRQTNIAKGIATIMLLCHHLFYDSISTSSLYDSLFIINGTSIEVLLSNFCKICVAIFVFLSGYGLYYNYGKYEKDKMGSTKFFLNRWLKLMSNYWIVYLLFVPLGFLFNRSPVEIYEGNILYFIIDFFGLSNLFFGFLRFTMNGTWWFISLIVVLYMLYPFVFMLLKKKSIIAFCLGLIAICLYSKYDHMELSFYLLSLILGSIFAKEKLFEKAYNLFNKKPILTILVLFLLIIASFFIRIYGLYNLNMLDGLFCVPIILLSFLLLSKVKLLNLLLEKIGKLSGMIFLMHTFIYSYYFKDFIYISRNPVLIFLSLLIISYLVSFIITSILKAVNYYKIFNIKWLQMDN